MRRLDGLTPKVLGTLREAGAVLARQQRHYVFRLANGRSVVFARTPSGRHTEKTQLADIRRALRMGPTQELGRAA